MFDLLITGLVAAPAIRIAADISTWCFISAAQEERERQWQIVRETRAELRAERQRQWEIESEARRRLAEERRATHQAHYELLGSIWDEVTQIRNESRDILQRFAKIRDENNETLRATALTPEQRAAVIECNQHLARGIERLRAYIGPYLQSFFEGIKEAQVALKNSEFIVPEAPCAVLPQDFPYVGELLEFDAPELMDFPFVDLGEGEIGRFVSSSATRQKHPNQVIRGLITRYDRASRFWILSAAKGQLIGDIASGKALVEPREVVLEDHVNDLRYASWEHESGERVVFRVPDAALFGRTRRAPWGTKASIFVHGADFLLNRIEAGQQVARASVAGAGTFPCAAPADFWSRYEFACEFSNRLLIREAGLSGDPKGVALVVRLSTGEEFPIWFDRGANTISIGPQCGARLGLVQANGRHLLIFVFRGSLTPSDSPYGQAPAEFFESVARSFGEQKELLELVDLDNLELKKYSAVLEAEFDVSSMRHHQSVKYSEWAVDPKSAGGQYLVTFTVPPGTDVTGAVRLVGTSDVLGWVRELNVVDGLLTVGVLPTQRQGFNRHVVPQRGAFQIVHVNRELQKSIDAIDRFISASAAPRENREDQVAFSIIRRELLGHFIDDGSVLGVGNSTDTSSGLDTHQERAVSIISGPAPVVLVQGPPGTGKTHVIAHAISRLIASNPKARIVITSQANPAVDEAVAKIQSSFPNLQIFRDYSVSAREKYASLDRGVGVEEYFHDLAIGIKSLTPSEEPRVKEVRQWLNDSFAQNEDFWRREIRRMLSHGSQIVACTLSRLADLSGGAQSFDLVIVDEAAKASVPETMIAANCARRLVLVGDHQQLLPFLDDSYFEHSAPTSDDKLLLEALWRDSLFARLWRSAPENRKAFLAIMRRSRQPIAECISTCFYEGALLPGRTHDSPSLSVPVSLMWVDSRDGRHDRVPGQTIQNRMEAALILSGIRELKKFCEKPVSIGVIAFHRGQAELLRRTLDGAGESSDVHILTVDASQGGQWDVVILSLGRTHGPATFVGNPNRLNVAISRAKELCLIVGSLRYARSEEGSNTALRTIADFVQSEPRFGKWTCSVGFESAIPADFRFPSNWRRRS